MAPPASAVQVMWPKGASTARNASVSRTLSSGLSSPYWISAPSAYPALSNAAKPAPTVAPSTMPSRGTRVATSVPTATRISALPPSSITPVSALVPTASDST
jgi:hypothetical protein